MELTWAQQSAAFGYSVLLGVALSVLYGLLSFWRAAVLPGRAVVFALDAAFMLIWALAGFCFSLAFLYGYVRLYVFAGSLLGFLLHRLTLGKCLCRVYRPAIRQVRRILQKICEKSKLFAEYLLKIACKVLYNRNRRKESRQKKRKIQSDFRKRNCHDRKQLANKKQAQKTRTEQTRAKHQNSGGAAADKNDRIPL